VDKIRARLVDELQGCLIDSAFLHSSTIKGAGAYCFWVAFPSNSTGMTEVEAQNWDAGWRPIVGDAGAIPAIISLYRDGVPLLHFLEQKNIVLHQQQQIGDLRERNGQLEAALDEIDQREARQQPQELLRLKQSIDQQNNTWLAVMEKDRAQSAARLQHIKASHAAEKNQMQKDIKFWEDKCKRHEQTVGELTEMHELLRKNIEEILSLRTELENLKKK
jgi:hypothetical protein